MNKINKKWIKENISSLVSQKCVIITGAGISVTAGIPDFRSKEGIFYKIKEKYNINGMDLFTYSFGLSEKTRNIYLKFIAEFKELILDLKPSFDHHSLKKFLSFQKKHSVYSQNICGLEKKAGITNLVSLHGDTDYLKCMQCGTLHEFTSDHIIKFKEGEEVECHLCKEKNKERKRPSYRGYLHPNILHYEEDHPNSADLIDKVMKDKDLTLLIVIGTSLKPTGVKHIIKYFLSQMEHRKKKREFVSLYVNKEMPNKVLSSFFTHFWHGSIEEFFNAFFNATKKEDSLLVNKVNLFQNDSVIDSFVEEMSSFIKNMSFSEENISNSNITNVKNGRINKYRTIIMQEDGQLQVKLPNNQNISPLKKNITVANPKNYSPLLKKNKKNN